ncbi:hypothetical protein BaRGS_00022647 [Batillaria attramentaria]|uniref:Uncharacterized protein n=1 Tax=Batillaria attramentaria TaxID=370345 RepID=A0ABD0KFP4_9CAEN
MFCRCPCLPRSVPQYDEAAGWCLRQIRQDPSIQPCLVCADIKLVARTIRMGAARKKLASGCVLWLTISPLYSPEVPTKTRGEEIATS